MNDTPSSICSPSTRVRLDQAPLGDRERRGLLQDAVGDPDLADVVEQEAVLDARVVQQLGRAHRRELDRVALHALRVRARARVLRLERARERGDGVVVGGVEQRALLALDLEQVAKVARVEEQLLLGSHAARRPARARRSGHRRAARRPRAARAG